MNTYQLIDNPLLTSGGTATEAEIKQRAAPIFTRLAAWESFTPVSATVVGDWSIQAGDVIQIATAEGIKRLPVYTQTIEWNGGAKTRYQSTGAPKRPVQNIEIRERNTSNAQSYAMRSDISSLRSGVGGLSSRADEIEEALSYAEINIDEANAYIQLVAGSVSEVEDRVSQAEIDIDGANAQIALKASQSTVDELGERVSSAELSIDGANAQIELKVNKDGVISSINQTPESITINASKINLSGYVTASQLSSLQAELGNLTSGTVQASHLYTQNLTATNTVRLSGHTCTWSSLKVCTGVHYTKSLQNVPGANGVTYSVIGSVTVSGDYETINFMSY